MSALHQKDCYKIGHISQYPKGTTEIYSNFTARSGKNSNIPDSKGVYFVGLQYFIMDYLIEEWQKTFFDVQKESAVRKYQRRVSAILDYEVDVSHVEALHDLGYLPVVIKALPEGSFVPYGVPMLTIRNTLPEFYWVTNMLESVLSAELWQPITTATTYMAYKELFVRYAKRTSSPLSFVPHQGHDFSFRGMPGRKAAAISGFAVLACGGVGTDCIPAIDLAEDFYYADCQDMPVGESINATEHSVMCAWGADNELKTFENLITQVYPEGNISIVSDSWDFWKTVTEYLPALKDLILARNGKLVIRPDSGDPVDIICGLSGKEGYEIVERTDGETHLKNLENGTSRVVTEAEQKGLITLLWEQFGGSYTDAGYKVLNEHIGAIYGDSITYDRAERILFRLYLKGFASCNIVFGIGSYTYQMVTRDTHGMAVKSTHAIINGKHVPIFKDPKTDDGVKKSAKGYLTVSKVQGAYVLQDMATPKQEAHGCLEKVFENGNIFRTTSLSEIRELTSLK